MWKTLNKLLNKPTNNDKITKMFVESNSKTIIEDPEKQQTNLMTTLLISDLT